MFFVAYRCRDCRRRELHLTPRLLVAAAFMTGLVATFVIGLAIGNWGDDPSASTGPAAGSPLPAPAANAGSATASPRTGGDRTLAEAAEGGDAYAQLRLGLAYMHGNRVPRNLTTALAWIEKAAVQGHAEAQYELGNLHLTGLGALQSFPLAMHWFQKSAHQNNANAQYRLGLMLRSGQGATIDTPKAYFWFNLAAAQGHELARSARDGLLPSLKTEQVVAAQRAALEWRPDEAQK